MRPSPTAQLAAAHRAYHLIQARPTILEDTAAGWLLGPPLSLILRVAPLRWLFWKRLLAKVRPVSVFVVVRSRYTEDILELSIRDGCRQYVILGAGLDSWALRHDEQEVGVFELDRPATQQWKEARIQARLGKLPSRLVLIPIDLEREAISDVLPGRGFDPESRAFVSWLGTLCYLRVERLRRCSLRWPRCVHRAAGLCSTIFYPSPRCRPSTCSYSRCSMQEAHVAGSPCRLCLSRRMWLAYCTLPAFALLRTCRLLRSDTAI